MQVKCRICGEKIDRDIAYKIVVNGKNLYYHSEAEYNDWVNKKEKEKIDRDRLFTLINEILGFEVIPSLLMKEKIEWNVAQSDENIVKYLEENKNYLVSATLRATGNNYGKTRYLSAIMKKALMDYKPKVVEEVISIPIAEEYYETKYKRKERVGLMDIEEEYDE